jgi:N-methylhydantoinase B/oxoprolinase/acetone carboxylase alpha subunit
LPAGIYEAEDMAESDGLGNGPFRVRVKITVSADRLVADFTGTDKQAAGPINCTRTGLVTGVRCVFKSITNLELPANGGCFRPLEIICPPGTFISAQSPAPVSLYYESLLAAMDVMWKALAYAMPDRLLDYRVTAHEAFLTYATSGRVHRSVAMVRSALRILASSRQVSRFQAAAGGTLLGLSPFECQRFADPEFEITAGRPADD